MSQDSRKVRFGLWYDFRNPPQWRQSPERLYGEILDQIVWGENNGFDDVWLSEHHFIEDGYLPSILPIAAAIAARTKRIRIASGVLLLPFHNPVRLAEDIAVVDVISGGRFELGAGVGYKARRVRKLRRTFQGARFAHQRNSRDRSPSSRWGDRHPQEPILRPQRCQDNAGTHPETPPTYLDRRLHSGRAPPWRSLWRWFHRTGCEPRSVRSLYRRANKREPLQLEAVISCQWSVISF